MNYIPTDGYNTTHKYQSLSNRGYFGSLYTSIFGFSDNYNIEYTDSTGKVKNTTIKTYYPAADTFARSAYKARQAGTTAVPQRKKRKTTKFGSAVENDSTNHVAMMDLNSFGRGYGLKGFFRRSFKAYKKTISVI